MSCSGRQSSRTDIAQATGLAQAVTVNNTTSNPVPVLQQGTATVSVADNHEPFQQALNVFMLDDVLGGNDSFTVPAGKRLVVQYIAVRASVPPDQGIQVDYQVGDEPGTPRGGLPIVSGGLVGDFVRWAGGGPVLAYVDAGEDFLVWAERADANGQADDQAGMTAIVTGYLVPSS